MNLLVKQTAREVSEVSTAPADHSKSEHRFFWSMGVIVSALYQLGIFALKRGGTVEFQCGPLKYKVNGRIKGEENKGSTPQIDLP